ncbi:MAG: DNA methyltransferase, partial [Actinomycetota bacterium]
MPPLPRELRKILEDAVVKARGDAEQAAAAALVTIGLEDERPHASLSQDERTLRLALRAKLRQLGSLEALIAEIAYQHWHRMLFARFLIENKVLIHPEFGVAVSSEELADLAKEQGEPDPWVLAADFASKMLPAIFRVGDPELALPFAPEGRQAQEQRLAGLPREVFTAEDALGWVYQFWQSERKKQVNASETKIGAAELPAVTQLFTEDYMVRFLLENSLGAWWAARHPDSSLLDGFAYLRYTDEGAPAAGSFDGWPQTVAEVTVMDPCCGSGHFLTAAFEMLAAMRMEEEGLDAERAGDAVIAANLFGLELDPRCTQIAAFALALAAWKHGGYRELPGPNIACSGTPVKGQLEEWKRLAEGDERLENAFVALHEQFRNAPELGSLIDPRRATDEGHLFEVDFDEVAPLLAKLLEREHDPEVQVAGWAATGIAEAAALLARTYTLVATNVPYLHRQKQAETLRTFLGRTYQDASAELATTGRDRVSRPSRRSASNG